jgi:serine/threonine protein kinase
MGRIEVPDSSSSDEGRTEESNESSHGDPTKQSNGDGDDGSSTLSDLSQSPSPPPEIHIPVAPTGHRVRFNLATEDNDHNNDVLRDVVRHENIVDFYHVEANDIMAAEDGLEDVDYDHNDPPEYIPHFTDICTLQELINESRKPPGIPTSKHSAGLTEGLVWHVMLSVLRALAYLHTGQKVHPTKRDPPPGWMPIVHNGIRPENIIFEHPISKHSKHLVFRFGACRLGNFARCVVLPTAGEFGSEDPEDLTDEERTAVAERHEAFGELFYKGEEFGYEAPEIIAEDVEETHYPGPLSDLWSLGALGVEMMTCRNVWDLVLEIEFKDKAQANYHHGQVEERWRHVSMENRHELLRKFAGEARIVKGLPRLYSHSLRVLIEALLGHNPWNRGKAQDVLQDAEQRYETWRRPTGKGHRIYETEAMDEIIDDVKHREELHRIREAEDFLRRFNDRDRAGR